MDYKTYQRIPNCLRKYRIASGLKQKDVARKMGLRSASRISRWEKGESIPNIVNAFKLSIIYHVMNDALFIVLIRSLREEIKHIEESSSTK
jgi:transcriptional regulator with XRE-family HTH domain